VEKGRANAALEQITATMRGATNQRGEMTNLKANTERESIELARRKVIFSFFSVRYRYRYKKMKCKGHRDDAQRHVCIDAMHI